MLTTAAAMVRGMLKWSVTRDRKALAKRCACFSDAWCEPGSVSMETVLKPLRRQWVD